MGDDIVSVDVDDILMEMSDVFIDIIGDVFTEVGDVLMLAVCFWRWIMCLLMCLVRSW